jgi:type III restriction enzyme
MIGHPSKYASRVEWPQVVVAVRDRLKGSEHASIQYEGYLVAGVERWKEYREQLAPLGKKPVLFVMLTNTDQADDVGDCLRKKYPDLLGGDKTLVIHTNTKGEITEAEVERARKLAREVDADQSEVGAIVSVLMLREGWDVQNVTVVVGLRPFTAKANILPEQAIGRGLRLMFRGQPGSGYPERVDIIGNNSFLEFVDDLEKLEDIKLGEFEVGKDKVVITTIMAGIGDRSAAGSSTCSSGGRSMRYATISPSWRSSSAIGPSMRWPKII